MCVVFWSLVKSLEIIKHMKKNLLTEKEISPWVHRAHHVSSGWRKVWTESNAGNSSHFNLSPQSQKDVSLASFRLLKLFFMERWEVNKNATNTFGRHKNKADDYHELTILDRLPIDIFAKRKLHYQPLMIRLIRPRKVFWLRRSTGRSTNFCSAS